MPRAPRAARPRLPVRALRQDAYRRWFSARSPPARRASRPNKGATSLARAPGLRPALLPGTARAAPLAAACNPDPASCTRPAARRAAAASFRHQLLRGLWCTRLFAAGDDHEEERNEERGDEGG